MKQTLPLIILSLLVSCSMNMQDQGILGTWNYKVPDAPFGFQTGKVIFFEANDSIQARIKIYGISIETANLKIESTQVSFTTQIEHEQIAIQLEKKEDKLLGKVLASEGEMEISMTKKGRKDRELKDREPKDRSGRKSRKSKDRDILLGRALLHASSVGTSDEGYPNNKVHTFYYGWYGNPAYDGNFRAWNHQIREAGIGVVAISWWGKDHFTDSSVEVLLNAAHAHGLKLVFHIESIYTTVAEFRAHLEYISSNYLQHPAIYRMAGKPLYYLYNSFRLNHHEWDSLLNPDSRSTIRNTSLDGVFIGLWTTGFDGEFLIRSGFDGFYTYFASDGFAFGSTTSNWPEMAAFARENNLIYIPNVGPGYADTRIRPWNEETTRSRDQGLYYEEMFRRAVETSADFISITSFNEWHEGTQIEPAIPKKIPSFTYEDYGAGTDPVCYIRMTKTLIDTYFNL